MKDTYHHGDLRREMIKKGMEMLSREGIEKFSMRKLASELGVSHTAPYRHFKNKTDAIKTILTESSEAFTRALQSTVNHDNSKDTGMEKLIQLGIGYVKFFVENPEFLKFFFIISGQASILESLFPTGENNRPVCENPQIPEIKSHRHSSKYESLSEESSYGIFRSIASEVFDQFPGLSEKEILLGYWAKVHGLASLLIAQPDFIPKEKQDEVIERIIRIPF